MTQTIVSVIEGVIHEMRKHGIKEITVTNYYNRLFKPILRHFHQNGENFYSAQVMRSYLEYRTEQLMQGVITEHYYKSLKRMVGLTDSYALAGHISFNKAGRKAYIPSSDHMEVLQDVLSNNKSVKVTAPVLAIMRHFFCFIEAENLSLHNVTDKTFFDFMVAISEINRTNHRNTLLSLKLISEYLRAKELADVKADFSLLRLKQNPIKAIAPFSKEEISKMFSCINTDSPVGLRDSAILKLAYSTGLRAVDIISLKLSDIDWKEAQLNIRQQKTQKQLELPLNADVMNAIAEYILKGRPSCNISEIFLTSRTPYGPFKRSSACDVILQKYCIKSGVEKKDWRSFHSLRRSFASEMSAAEVPLPTISQMLGHINIDSCRPYLSYNRPQMLSCAIGFEEIPITTGIYSGKCPQEPATQYDPEVPEDEF